MKNRTKVIITLFIVTSFILGSFFGYLYLKVTKNNIKEPLIGSFSTNVSKPNSDYLTFLDENTVVLYNQNNLYIEGSVESLEDNIYRFTFTNEEIYAVYYGDKIILIYDETVEKYTKFSNVIEFLGIEK